jgi:alpha-tubulin suppressor-like RCC1 family protein
MISNPPRNRPGAGIVLAGLAALPAAAWTAPAAAQLEPLLDVVVVAVGSQRTCALGAAGEVTCWGRNLDGELGNGELEDSRLPRPVAGLPDNVVDLVAGAAFHCALDALGGIWCWGRNGTGQLGDGSTTDRFTPAPVTGLGAPATSMAAGYGHACAVLAGGQIVCWGSNLFGELGTGSTTSSPVPVPVAGLPGPMRVVAAGLSHTCAISAADGAWCWGDNVDGQLGDDSDEMRLQPVAVVSLGTGVDDLAVGDLHSCAVRSTGQVWCWGRNTSGQLGDASQLRRQVPVQVSGLNGAVQVDGGAQHTCARRDNGQAFCWGGNGTGALGDGSVATRLTPAMVQVSQVVDIGTGNDHSCALRSGGRLWCWGSNGFGALGDGSRSVALQPLPVAATGPSIQEVAMGTAHTCVRPSDGPVRCWGGNNRGQLGDGTVLQRLQPSPVVGSWQSARTLVARGDSTCVIGDPTSALDPRGVGSAPLHCWGHNNFGQLGVGGLVDPLSPVLVTSASDSVTSIGLGGSHACLAYGGTGFRLCSGSNTAGQACRGDLVQRDLFLGCDAPLAQVASVRSGSTFSCALTAIGAVQCWGSNVFGQLGNGGGPVSANPVPVAGLGAGVVEIVAGREFACARLGTGAVQCWGRGNFGQLGNGGTADALTPTPVTGLASGVIALAAGDNFACAQLDTGAVRCWGRNLRGQLGDGTNTDRLTPIPVSGLNSGVQALAAGGEHACAVMASGPMRCWGSDSFGQLGQGTAGNRALPAPVLTETLDTIFASGFEVQP